MSFLTRAIGAAKLAAKAHGPTIMVISGVTSMGASVVMASKKTLELEKVLEPHVDSLTIIEQALEAEVKNYTEKGAAKDRGQVYARVTVDVVKLYAVPSVLFIGGACLVFGGHRIMLQRNATLAIAFTGVQKAFEAYRQRAREEMGPEFDQAMMNGWVKKEVIDPETNEVRMVNSRDWETSGTDPYNRVFSRENSIRWIDDLSVNKMFIQQQQRMAQILLGHRGYLYLSEVYEALGFPETDISRVVGWKETLNPDGSKDIPVIDFGLDRSMPDDWKYTKDAAVYLDFNCQGLIVGGQVQKALEKA